MNNKHVAVPADIFELHPSAFVLEVEGDVMAPSIPNGSYIAVDPRTSPAKDGSEFCIVRYRDGQYICRLIRAMGQAVMLFDNPKYQSVTLPLHSVSIVGTVVWVQKSSLEQASDHRAMELVVAR